MNNIWQYLVEIITQAWLILGWARLFLQKGGLSYSHPLSQFCVKGSDFIVKPMRKIIPPVGSWDFALVIALYLVQILITFLMVSFSSAGFTPIVIAYIFIVSFLLLLKAMALTLIIGIVIKSVLSFFAPDASFNWILDRILLPLSKPFKYFRIGHFDFSLAILCLILWMWAVIGVPYLIYQLTILI